MPKDKSETIFYDKIHGQHIVKLEDGSIEAKSYENNVKINQDGSI